MFRAQDLTILKLSLEKELKHSHLKVSSHMETKLISTSKEMFLLQANMAFSYALIRSATTTKTQSGAIRELPNGAPPTIDSKDKKRQPTKPQAQELTSSTEN